MLLLAHLREKRITESQDVEILAARAICYLHMSYNFEPVLHEYALVFGQSYARDFFSCIP